jgi:hypothetical protein
MCLYICLYRTSLWVECIGDFGCPEPPCSGTNSVVSLACICFLLPCQFLPDHAKIVRFVALIGQLTAVLRTCGYKKLQHFCHLQHSLPFPSLLLVLYHEAARWLKLLSAASFTYSQYFCLHTPQKKKLLLKLTATHSSSLGLLWSLGIRNVLLLLALFS